MGMAHQTAQSNSKPSPRAMAAISPISADSRTMSVSKAVSGRKSANPNGHKGIAEKRGKVAGMLGRLRVSDKRNIGAS